MPSKAQQVFERVEALTAGGVKKADAFRQVADELGQPFNSIRGAYYTHTRSIGGTPGAAPRRHAPVDPIEQAVGVLRQALDGIDVEIAQAKERADEAAAHYKELRDSAATRKAQIEAKIEVLSAEA
jgi:hypothetical protein